MTAQHTADYRRRNPDYLVRQKKLANARRRALNKLAAAHPVEFEVLLHYERAALDVLDYNDTSDNDSDGNDGSSE